MSTAEIRPMTAHANNALEQPCMYFAGDREPAGSAKTMELARLFAAAPALLAACKAYLTAKPQCECSDDSGCSMAAARKLATAAIALTQEQANG